MNRAEKVFLLLLISAASTATAQEASFSRFEQIPGCDRDNSSRLPSGSNCGEVARPPIVIRHELESTTLISVPDVETRACRADIAISYTQSNAVARVDTTLENDTCGASSGSFVFSLSTRNQSAELETQEFQRSWEREDDRAVIFSDEFQIGADVELKRVRVSRIRCRCDDPD